MKKFNTILLISALAGTLPAISLITSCNKKAEKMVIDESAAYKEVYGHFVDEYATYGTAYLTGFKYSKIDLNDLQVEVDGLSGITATTTATIVKDEENEGYFNVVVTFDTDEIIFTKKASFNLIFTNKKDTSDTIKVQGCTALFLSYLINIDIEREKIDCPFSTIPNSATVSSELIVFKGLTEPITDLSDFMWEVEPTAGSKTNVEATIEANPSKSGYYYINYKLTNITKGSNTYKLIFKHKHLPSWSESFNITFNVSTTNSPFEYKLSSGKLTLNRVNVLDEEITIPDNAKYNNVDYPVTDISTYAFYNKANVKKINLGNKITTIKSETFSSCDQLETINISSSVTKIEVNPFKNCPKLTNVVVNSDNTNYSSKKNIDSQEEAGCIWEKSSNTLIASGVNPTIPTPVTKIGNYGMSYTNLKSIDLPTTITEIGISAFKKSEALETVNIPNTITSISEYAFEKCISLNKVTLPNSIETIEKGAFDSCYSLADITLPEGLKTIEEEAFCGCLSLAKINIPSSVTEIETGVFYSDMYREEIKVAAGNTAYSDRGSNCIVEESTKTLLTGCSTTTIPNDIEVIAKHAFCNMWLEQETLKLPASVKQIGQWAFAGNVFTKVDLSACTDLTTIGAEAFQDDIYLESVVLPASPNAITEIGERAFESDISLTSIDLSGCTNLTELKSATFAECSYLETITLPNSIIKIGECVFEECESLETIQLPTSLTTLGYRAFEDCTSLKTINLHECTSLNNLPDNCFKNTAIEEVTVPASVTMIENPFPECNNLKTIVVADDNTVFTSKDGDTQCNCICTKSDSLTKALIVGCQNTVVPSFVQTIKAWSFQTIKSLKNINIPASVTKIEADAFYECDGLEEATFAVTNNWYYGNDKIDEEILKDIHTAGQYLRTNYNENITRKA